MQVVRILNPAPEIKTPTPFAAKVAVLNSTGGHLRFVPGTLAESMVSNGSAAPQPAGGKVREVALTRPAHERAERIGPSDGRANGVRFYRWVRLDQSASRIIEHHPRCLWKL